MNYLMYIAAIAVLIVVLKILTFPIKLIGKFVINSIIGGIILYFLAKFGIMLAITWWVVVLTGFFGIPGLGIAFLISLFI